jgi:hypothetical protein
MRSTLSNHGSEPDVLTKEPDDGESGGPAPLATLAQEVELLRAEKAALRHTLDELEGLLEQKMQAAQTTYAQQQKQEALLEEKTEEIRELHLKLLEAPSDEARESGPNRARRRSWRSARISNLSAASSEPTKKR